MFIESEKEKKKNRVLGDVGGKMRNVKGFKKIMNW